MNDDELREILGRLDRPSAPDPRTRERLEGRMFDEFDHESHSEPLDLVDAEPRHSLHRRRLAFAAAAAVIVAIGTILGLYLPDSDGTATASNPELASWCATELLDLELAVDRLNGSTALPEDVQLVFEQLESIILGLDASGLDMDVATGLRDETAMAIGDARRTATSDTNEAALAVDEIARQLTTGLAAAGGGSACTRNEDP